MKRRLSDHDEWAFDRLARVAHHDWTRSRPAMEHVWFRDGWAYGSDSYRALVLPVEIEGAGAVSRHDALLGGTVDVTVGPAGKTLPDVVDGVQLGPIVSETVINPQSLPALREWERRRPTFPWNELPATCVAADGVGPLADINGEEYAFCEGAPFAVQAPYLASIVLPLTEAAGGLVSMGVTNGAAPVVLWCADPADGWGLVMPVRVHWSIPWEVTA